MLFCSVEQSASDCRYRAIYANNLFTLFCSKTLLYQICICWLSKYAGTVFYPVRESYLRVVLTSGKEPVYSSVDGVVDHGSYTDSNTMVDNGLV